MNESKSQAPINWPIIALIIVIVGGGIFFAIYQKNSLEKERIKMQESANEFVKRALAKQCGTQENPCIIQLVNLPPAPILVAPPPPPPPPEEEKPKRGKRR